MLAVATVTYLPILELSSNLCMSTLGCGENEAFNDREIEFLFNTCTGRLRSEYKHIIKTNATHDALYSIRDCLE